MARRRSAPAPRRSAPAPSRPTAVVTKPANQMAPQPVVVQGQSMLGNIASTAAGVAVGHTAGHMLVGAFSGSGSRDTQVEGVEPVAAAPQQQFHQQQQSPCQNEMQQFLNCSQQQQDLSLCEGFNQILKECRLRYSNPSL